MNNLIQFCIKLKNAVQANARFLWVKENKLILNFVKLLFKEGFILGVEKQHGLLKISLKYDLLLTSSIQNVRILSTPTKHFYLTYKNLVKLVKLDTLLLLTSEGILVGNEAVKRKIGGKLICSIF